jgi:hypothetical protein
MCEKANQSGPNNACPVVLFGIDSRGKPKAARFGKQHAGLALKAATQLQLQVLASNDPKIADLASQLPVGRVHATGRMFVPFIRRDLYDQLVAAAPNGNLHQPPTPPASGAGSGAAGSRPPGSSAKLPRNWQEIGIGDLVVAQQSVEDGWYEAIVLEANGDMLTTRWRDYPRERKIVRHRLRLALLYPGPKASEETGRSLKASTLARRDQTIANASTQALPKDWREIDVNHLVVAKDDGPWSAWWEAIAIEKNGDLFKLRWRNNPTNAPPITRSRYQLAVICADAA